MDDETGQQAVDDWWETRVAEAEAAGGTTDFPLGDVPSTPRVAFALPSSRVAGGRKLLVEANGATDMVRLTIPGPDDPLPPAVPLRALHFAADAIQPGWEQQSTQIPDGCICGYLYGPDDAIRFRDQPKSECTADHGPVRPGEPWGNAQYE